MLKNTVVKKDVDVARETKLVSQVLTTGVNLAKLQTLLTIS
jgi:hypothetical protein